MNPLRALPLDLAPIVWVLGAFATSLVLLRLAERFAHTRARNRTRRAIETTTPLHHEIVQKKSDARASK